MKKLVMLLALVAMVAFTATAFATVSGSAHDFSQNSASGVYTSGTECGGCHKPHNAGTLIPLWNDGNTFDGTYTKYTSPTNTFDASDNATTNISNVSQACMACHDGTVMDGSTISASLATTTVGLDIDYATNANQHPIAFSYDDSINGATKDTELVAAGTVEGTLPLFGSTNKVECASCHDPHGTQGTGTTDAAGNYANFLRTAPADLCTTCHIK